MDCQWVVELKPSAEGIYEAEKCLHFHCWPFGLPDQVRIKLVIRVLLGMGSVRQYCYGFFALKNC